MKVVTNPHNREVGFSFRTKIQIYKGTETFVVNRVELHHLSHDPIVTQCYLDDSYGLVQNFFF